MRTPYESTYLQPDEQVVSEDRRHPLSVVDDVLFVTVLAAGGIVAAVLLTQAVTGSRWLTWALPWLVAIPTAWALYLFVRYRIVVTSRYVITDERVYSSHGRIRFTLVQTMYDKITDLHVHQGIFGRIWGFGTIRLHTAGAVVALAGVRRPFALKQSIEEARSRFIHRLVAEHKAKRAVRGPAAAPATAPSALRLVWQGRPAPESLIGPLIGTVGLLLPGAIMLFVGLVAPRAGVALLIGGVFMAMSILGLVGIFVRYRYTQYEITSQGLVVATGWLSRSRVETTYDKITDVTTHQSLLGRMLDYGRIAANTAGGPAAPILFQGVKSPSSVKALIEEARHRRRVQGAFG